MVKMCYPKFPYVIWDGSNLADVVEYCEFGGFLFEGSDFHVSAEGSQLVLDLWGDVRTLPSGTVLWGAGSPIIYTESDFAAAYIPISA